jgi:hypothetical protein
MRNENQSVTCRTASGGGGSFGRLSQTNQEVAKRVQILDGSYNAGSHYGLNVNAPVLKQHRGVWAFMREGQRRERPANSDIESSNTKSFWDVVRIGYFRMLRFIGH